MRHLFSPQGLHALAATLQRSPLIGFDFDGTLAPIVHRPEQARVPLPLRYRLSRLAARLPVAVVSGRSLADLHERLDFGVAYAVGNHGAEAEVASERPSPRAAAAGGNGGGELDALRERLLAYEPRLHAAGVRVEDKGLSLALHYRLAPNPDAAVAAIHALLRPFAGALRVFPGKMVENVTGADVPDKAVAMQGLVRHCGACCAIFFGDDANDEPVFASAPPDWLTVRVGAEDRDSRAAFFIHQPSDMVMVVDRMLRHLGEAAP